MTKRYQSLVRSHAKYDLIHTKLILCLYAAYTLSKDENEKLGERVLPLSMELQRRRKSA